MTLNPHSPVVPCAICGQPTDDWVHAQCRTCGDLPGAVLLTELSNACSWADARLGSAIDVEAALVHALAEAKEQRAFLENLSDLAQANHAQMLELVKQLHAVGARPPVCECGHSLGHHIVGGWGCTATVDRRHKGLNDCPCSCQKFRPRAALSFGGRP